MIRISLRPALLAGTVAVLLAACHVPAKIDRPALRDEAPLAGLATGTRAGWPAADWWRVYNDPQLDTLMDLALRGAPDLAQARTRVESAEQNIRVAAAQAGLRVDGSGQVARQRMSEHGLIPSQFLGFTWYNQADLGIQVRYDFDWWGKKRYTIESAIDSARAAEAERSASPSPQKRGLVTCLPAHSAALRVNSQSHGPSSSLHLMPNSLRTAMAELPTLSTAFLEALPL